MLSILKPKSTSQADLSQAFDYIQQKFPSLHYDRLLRIYNSYPGALDRYPNTSTELNRTSALLVLEILAHYYMCDAGFTGIQRNHYHMLINAAYEMRCNVLDVDKAIHKKSIEKKADKLGMFSIPVSA